MKKIISYVLYAIEIIVIIMILNYAIENKEVRKVTEFIITFILMINFIIIDILIEKLRK